MDSHIDIINNIINANNPNTALDSAVMCALSSDCPLLTTSKTHTNNTTSNNATDNITINNIVATYSSVASASYSS